VRRKPVEPAALEAALRSALSKPATAR